MQQQTTIAASRRCREQATRGFDVIPQRSMQKSRSSRLRSGCTSNANFCLDSSQRKVSEKISMICPCNLRKRQTNISQRSQITRPRRPPTPDRNDHRQQIATIRPRRSPPTDRNDDRQQIATAPKSLTPIAPAQCVSPGRASKTWQLTQLIGEPTACPARQTSQSTSPIPKTCTRNPSAIARSRRLEDHQPDMHKPDRNDHKLQIATIADTRSRQSKTQYRLDHNQKSQIATITTDRDDRKHQIESIAGLSRGCSGLFGLQRFQRLALPHQKAQSVVLCNAPVANATVDATDWLICHRAPKQRSRTKANNKYERH